jgi:hypothetical protein
MMRVPTEGSKPMKFQVSRTSLGQVSPHAPCAGAIRGSEPTAWPGEHVWYLELQTLDDLQAFLEKNGGALGLFSPEEGEKHPTIEIFDDDEDDDE